MSVWLVTLTATAALMVIAMVGVTRHYRTPQVRHSRTPADLGLDFTEVRIPTHRGRKLYGWWIPAAAGRAPVATVVLVHGWGRNLQRLLPFVPGLHEAGHDLLAFDARCHGSSDPDGTATMLKFSEDIRACLDEAERRGTSPGNVAVLGLSIGGSAAIHAAAHDPRIGAVVTVGAFADPAELMTKELARRGLPRPAITAVLRYVELRIGAPLREIAPERQIARLSIPVLLVHGREDAVVPVDHGRRLAAAAAPGVTLLELEGRGHSSCDDHPAFWPAVNRLLTRGPSAGQHPG